jgi:hypothetical protein
MFSSDSSQPVNSREHTNGLTLHPLTRRATIKIQTPWPGSASELYRPNGRCFSAKSVTTFADRGVSRSQLGGSPTAVLSAF